MSDQNSSRKRGKAADTDSRYDEELANPPKQRKAPATDRKGLKKGAEERSKKRPLLQKIVAAFQKEKTSFRELIINAEPLEKRVALLVDGVLEKYEIERESDNRMVGGIYKGRIKNLDPGLKAAFVDIGYNKNAFLHYWDMLPAAADSSVEVVRVNSKKKAKKSGAEPTVKDIPKLYPAGSEIVIQVTKGPHALQRSMRNLPQDRGQPRTPTSQAPHQRTHDPGRHGRDRAHRGRRQKSPLLRP